MSNRPVDVISGLKVSACGHPRGLKMQRTVPDPFGMVK